MIFAQTIATIALLIVSSLGPGLFFVRYLRWRPLETLCGSVALSFLLLYLAALIIYGFGLSPGWAYVPAMLALAATFVCTQDFLRLWRNRETRAAILAFLALFSWLLLFVLFVRNFSGGRWFGDWYEHFERSLFFSEHKPPDTQFLFHYILPARPPMMNLLAALYFWQVSPQFELFQVVFAYLNALSILPCALIAPLLVAKTRNRAWLIAGFLALSPMFLQNATFTWTKAFAAFYDLVAIGLYLSAWRRNDSPRLIAAAACLSMAMLVHYSAAPFVLFLGGHYLIALFRGRNHKWRELAACAAVSIAIFSTWLGWSLYAYGPKGTFASNTTVTASSEFSLMGNIRKIVANTINTFVPFEPRGPYETDPGYDPEHPPVGLAYLRDCCFVIYQTEFPAMLGFGGLILVVWLLVKLFRHPPDDPWQHRYGFWFCFVTILTFLSIAVHGEFDFFGVAHICLQPMVLLGLTLAAIGLPHVPRIVRGIALLGLLVDATLGVLLHFRLLHGVFDMSVEGNQLRINSNTELGMSAIRNGMLKFRFHVTFLGDHAAELEGLIEVIIVLGTLGIIIALWLLAALVPPGESTPVPPPLSECLLQIGLGRVDEVPRHHLSVSNRPRILTAVACHLFAIANEKSGLPWPSEKPL